MSDAEFLQQVKRQVHQIDPQAEVWLFGSRARGDAREDSDWDFLVLTEHPVDRQYKCVVRDHLFYLGLESGQVISTVIHNKSTWADLSVTHLYQNIKEDGVAV